MRNKTKWLLVAAVSALAALALAACGGDDSENGDNAGAMGHGGGAATGNQTDAMFVNGMIPHHEGAIEMAEIAKQRAEHPEIKKLADDIVTAQQREIDTMTPLRKQLSGHHGDAMMEGGHMNEDDIAGLKTADPFDRAFIDQMVPHHRSAVKMAEMELANGKDDTLRKLAEDIIAAQNREIEQMQAWRKDWYGAETGDGDDGTMGHGSMEGH
jgi:uncharacterized protein (DUF305 family)